MVFASNSSSAKWTLSCYNPPVWNRSELRLLQPRYLDPFFLAAVNVVANLSDIKGAFQVSSHQRWHSWKNSPAAAFFLRFWALVTVNVFEFWVNFEHSVDFYEHKCGNFVSVCNLWNVAAKQIWCTPKFGCSGHVFHNIYIYSAGRFFFF